ncbi:hypothetical protein HYC85_020472 [Camellia sinensis]|uniref:Uncharacterized protein n=1 Tax=Camellia sinensis TaxID=4442 RepID=A0A7J7GQ57_CAMSI|nr:hypothetical protein HYC85_020472 [Camellia sinensis]
MFLSEEIREISRRDLNNPRFIAMVTTEPNLVDLDYDEYAASESRCKFCCHFAAAIGNMSHWLLDFDVSILTASLISCLQFMVLLILRHTLPILVNGAQDYSFPLFLDRDGSSKDLEKGECRWGHDIRPHSSLPQPLVVARVAQVGINVVFP